MCRAIAKDNGMGCTEIATVQRQCGGCRLGDSPDADVLPRSEESSEVEHTRGHGEGSGSVQGKDSSAVPSHEPIPRGVAGDTEAYGPDAVLKVRDHRVKVFTTGAVRSYIRERYDLLPCAGVQRAALAMGEGAEKYGEHNWEKGFPMGDILNHALAHIYKHLSGDRTEDHLGHAAANLLMACSTEENRNGFHN